jgi:hypothetical protein
MIIQYMKYPSIINFQKDKYILCYIFIRSNIPYQVCNVNFHIPLGKKESNYMHYVQKQGTHVKIFVKVFKFE